MREVVAAALTATLSLAAATPSSHAALAINPNDIAPDGTYVYTLTSEDLIRDSENLTRFDRDVFSREDVWVNDEFADSNPNSNSRLVQASSNNQQTHGEFVYRFDFSGTGYRAVSATLTERVHVFGLTSTNNEETRITTGWRADGGSYTNLIDLDSTTYDSTVGVASVSQTPTITLPDAAIVDYRVTFDTLAGDGDGHFSGARNQWGRVGETGTAFQIEFTLTPVPEPAAAALLSPVALLLGWRRTRR